MGLIFNQESSANIAAAATVNGQSVDMSLNTAASEGNHPKFRGSIFADQAGTLMIQASRDGTTWRTSLSQATAVSTLTVLESIISRRYMRVAWTNNGGSTTTVLELDSVTVGS